MSARGVMQQRLPGHLSLTTLPGNRFRAGLFGRAAQPANPASPNRPVAGGLNQTGALEVLLGHSDMVLGHTELAITLVQGGHLTRSPGTDQDPQFV